MPQPSLSRGHELTSMLSKPQGSSSPAAHNGVCLGATSTAHQADKRQRSAINNPPCQAARAVFGGFVFILCSFVFFWIFYFFIFFIFIFLLVSFFFSWSLCKLSYRDKSSDKRYYMNWVPSIKFPPLKINEAELSSLSLPTTLTCWQTYSGHQKALF